MTNAFDRFFVFAIPKLLERNGLKVDDIDLWELNEAFASQAVYCRDKLGIPAKPGRWLGKEEREGSKRSLSLRAS